MKVNILIPLVVTVLTIACHKDSNTSYKKFTSASNSNSQVDTVPYPKELVNFIPHKKNPIFSGTGKNTWDQRIRERGYILKEGTIYHMWYTGYRTEDQSLSLGYATSNDGFQWTRYIGNPIFAESWTEDMMVVKVDSTYHMFAEGKDDIAHRLTSSDRVNWIDHGSMEIRHVDGTPLSEGPYGTPTVWFENNTWYLFYERNDQGIWLATSKDLGIWTNLQDEAVIEMGPETYDQYGLAVNQIIKYQGWYYAYYHGTAVKDWSEWTTNVAVSKDLVKWEKYQRNPIMSENKSSGILVHDGEQFRLYTMHNQVAVHFSEAIKNSSE